MISIKQYCNERLFKLSRIKLLPNEIHLWSINWKELEDYIHKYKNLISIQEEQRVYSFKFYEDRMRCMTGKILTKLLLAHYLEVDCLDIQICYEKNGKPYHMPIKDKRLIQFNVSHSGEFVFMGFAYEKRIGVDIEKINLSFQYQCISDKFLSKKEIEDINKSKNIEKFYNLWTAKEAYVKAIGIGLFKEFKSFSVSEDIIKENNKIEEGWFLKNIKLNEEYVACVVLQNKTMKGKIKLRKRDNNMEIFPYIQRMKKEKPYQLFCFPHAGGNSLTFAKWVDRSSKIDIIPISLSERGKENNYNNLVGIIAEKIIAILDDRPFFFWGHSMGAALAFSVSYYIEKKYNYFPEKLIVAARQPPFDPCAKSFRSSMGLSALLDELKNAGGTPRELLESDIFREYMLPEIMNDYVLHEGFKYHGEMINSSIVAHCGTEDIEANETIMLGWKEVTLKEFKITSFSGGHFFPHSYTKYLEELEKEIIN